MRGASEGRSIGIKNARVTIGIKILCGIVADNRGHQYYNPHSIRVLGANKKPTNADRYTKVGTLSDTLADRGTLLIIQFFSPDARDRRLALVRTTTSTGLALDRVD